MGIALKAATSTLVTTEHDGDANTEGVYVNGVKILGRQQNHIVDAIEAHVLNATFDNTEVQYALDQLGSRMNVILAALEAHGIVASS